MAQRHVLFVAFEPGLARTLAAALDRSGVVQVYCTTTVPEAIEAGTLAGFALVVIRLGARCGLSGLNELLWALSLAGRAVPVVAMRDRYDESEALTVFRMEVSEYLGLADHQECLVSVLSDLALRRRSSVATEAVEPRGWGMNEDRALALPQSV